MRTGRTLQVAAVALAIGVVLSGCTPVAPIYLGQVDGELAILICDTTFAGRITVSEHDVVSQGEIAWEAVGQTSIESGQVIAVGSALPGMTDRVGLAAQISSDVVSVGIQRTDAEGSPTSIIAGVFRSDLIETGKWVGDDDRVTDAPC